MTESYNVVAELDATIGEENVDALLGPIAEYSGAAARSELGRAEVVFTIPAASGRQAALTRYRRSGPTRRCGGGGRVCW
ncbi:hypothetical protein SIM91_18535 [Rhodococcus opacus]|uniref:hypothetical protein n=1 Tax=Rhodococcus opacus TaxID=37919 RepID=UPI0002A37F54|nr:hypothetical protein [Rhodococcus opacus]ELB89978.1 putative DNA binding protein [Rhodococcus wratislaviensis IFP 2016]MDX5965263.1 hypothetical protein [Rhodococcus opacus]CAG7618963.1 hypothetical protein E143388_06121 [Rhodococcus opacus]